MLPIDICSHSNQYLLACEKLPLGLIKVSRFLQLHYHGYQWGFDGTLSLLEQAVSLISFCHASLWLAPGFNNLESWSRSLGLFSFSTPHKALFSPLHNSRFSFSPVCFDRLQCALLSSLLNLRDYSLVLIFALILLRHSATWRAWVDIQRSTR